jgi:hypothetical protein
VNAKLPLHPHAGLVQRDRSIGLSHETLGERAGRGVWVRLCEPTRNLCDRITRHAFSSVQLPSASA